MHHSGAVTCADSATCFFSATHWSLNKATHTGGINNYYWKNDELSFFHGWYLLHCNTWYSIARQGLTDQKKARSDVVEKREISTIVYTCYFPLTGKYKAPSEEFLNRK